MPYDLAKPEQLAQLCKDAPVEDGLQVLCDKLNDLMPELEFSHVTTRGHWHRLGGVIDADYTPVSDNIVQWAEEVSGGDVDEIIAAYGDKGYFATRIAGTTHYLSASTGEAPEDFIQIEIEELCEVLDRPLIQHDWFPESIEEFLDPLDYPRLEPEPIGKPWLQFRRITPVKQLLTESSKDNQALFNLRRFFDDWMSSSASEHGLFCHHWALALREYTDTDGECRISAKPFSTFEDVAGVLAQAGELHGVRVGQQNSWL